MLPQRESLVSEKKNRKQKDSQLVIRINADERHQFIDLCADLDTSAAREIRRFIRDFIQDQSPSD